MKRGSSHKASRWSGWMMLTVMLASLAGCIIIPTDYHAKESRENVNIKTREFLKVGVTTKEEVYLEFGEPDYASEDGRQLGYQWTKVKAIWAVGGYGGGVGGEIRRTYIVEASFDESNRVSRVQLIKEWGHR